MMIEEEPFYKQQTCIHQYDIQGIACGLAALIVVVFVIILISINSIDLVEF
jgi:hypothetical protein